MALLGLFSKRDKNKTSGSSTTGKSSGASLADTSSVADTSEYVLPERDLPTLPNQVYANGSTEASSSKFHLGFRKRSTPASDAADNNFLRPPQFPLSPSTRSEADLDVLRPPPSRSDLLAAYGDPKSALSTRSLPDAQPSAQDGANAAHRASNESPAALKKQGGLFSWAHRERKKSKVSDVPPSLSVDVNAESFNLKAFRHVRPESPSPDASLSSSVLTPPVIPRPRGNSVASVDSSQRISVAAFREMAARRSAAPSPNSSPVLLRPPSRTDSLEHSHLRPAGSSFQRTPVVNRGSTLAQHDSSSSESEESAEESESDESAGSSTMRPRRQRTITQKSAGKASTELGHITRSPIALPASRSALGHGEDASDSGQSQRPQAGGFFRSRASQSASALHPNAAARRASQLVAEKAVSTPPPRPKPVPAELSDRARGKLRARESSSDSSSSSDSDDSDDAPLASLVRPPRPGSAASNATSGSRSRMPTKPFIDITQLGGTPPPMPSLPRSEQASPSPAVLNKRVSPPLPDKQAPAPIPSKRTTPPVPEKDQPPSTNIKTNTRPTHSEKPSLSDRLARVAQSAGGKSVEALATATPLERRSLDLRPVLSDSTERGRVSQPTRSQTAPMGMLDRADSPSPSPSPMSRPRANTRQQPPSPNAAAVYDLTDPQPIVPTLIRERSPPPAFAVTSRPPSQLSLNTTGRLSGSQATIRMVNSGSESASSSPTAPTSFGGSSSSSATPATTVSSDSPVFSSTAAYSSAAFTKISTPPTSSSPSSRPSPGGRQRSSTLIPSGAIHSTNGFTGGGLLASSAATPSDPKSSSNNLRTLQQPAAPRGGRSRSSTMLPQMDISPLQRTQPETESAPNSRMSSSTSSPSQSQPQNNERRLPQRSRMPYNASSPTSVVPPSRPFAVSERGVSPASSTGDSSSGRTPLTPADGSDLGLGDSRSTISGVSALAGAKRMHRRGASVSFEDELEKDRRWPAVKTAPNDEERRKERRRSEAKAAIELGKVVNGKITLDDDNDEDMPLNSLGPRMGMANPMLNLTPASPMTWTGSPVAGSMMGPSPFMMPPPNADPRFLAAHQHAMMVAKQAYQMAVAQQAMAAANDEWERGSNASAFGGMSMSSMGGMGGMPGMMPGVYGMGWNNPMMYSSAQTMYAGSTAGSEIGVGWGSRSEYGGPARNSRTSAVFSSRQSTHGLGAGQRSESQPLLASASSARPGVRPRTKTSPSDSALPTQHSRTRQAPPSSWKQ